MLKKLKNKENKIKNNTILDFIMEIKQKHNQKNIKLSNRNENKKLEKDLRKLKKEKNLTENYFNENLNSTFNINGQPFSIKNQSILGIYKEDKENINQLNLSYLNNKTKDDNLNTKINKTSKNKIKNYNKDNDNDKDNDNKDKNKILNFSYGKTLKNFEEKNENFSNKINKKVIEFYDEFNNKKRIMTLFEEKDFEFFKSEIFPPLKFMSVDNDILSEDEQIKDAHNMLKDNLKETIKLTKKDKKFFEKNLSNFDYIKDGNKKK
jgi:hypothetical protein